MFRLPLNGYVRPVPINGYVANSERTIQSKKNEKGKKFSLRRATLKDFLDNTSLHGLNVIGSTRVTLFER